MSDTSKTQSPSSVYRMAVGVIVVVGLVATFAVIMPQLKARSAANQAATAATSEGAELQTRVAMLKQKAADKQGSVERLTKLTQAFPSTYSQAQFFNLLRKSAESSGVKIKSITNTEPTNSASAAPPGAAPGTPAAPPAIDPAAAPGAVPAAGAPMEEFSLAQVSLSMTVEGDGVSMERFLKGLSSLSRPVIVDSVTLSDSGAAAISARTYLSRPLVVPNFAK